MSLKRFYKRLYKPAKSMPFETKHQIWNQISLSLYFFACILKMYQQLSFSLLMKMNQITWKNKQGIKEQRSVFNSSSSPAYTNLQPTRKHVKIHTQKMIKIHIEIEIFTKFNLIWQQQLSNSRKFNTNWGDSFSIGNNWVSFKQFKASHLKSRLFNKIKEGGKTKTRKIQYIIKNHLSQKETK